MEKVRETETPSSVLGMFPPAGAAPVQVMSCSSSTIFQVTVPPAAMVTADGEKAWSPALTVAVLRAGGGAAGAAVAGAPARRGR